MSKNTIGGIVATVSISGAVALSILGGSEVIATALIGLATSVLSYIFGFNTYNPDLRDPVEPE